VSQPAVQGLVANPEAERYRAFVALLGRLSAERGIPMLAAGAVEAEAARRPLLAALFTGDPTRVPESWDVAVILPELMRACRGFAGATLDPVQSRVAAARFGVDKFPALVVLRHGEYTGVIEGMRDWLPFCAELARLGSAPACEPPRPLVDLAVDPLARPA
jgi:hydrogenase-1 operon protein HyaE